MGVGVRHYVCIGTKWVYVAIIMDQGSRRVVGWAISTSLSRHYDISALQMALQSNQTPKYHHSDRGVQYWNHDYIRLLKRYQITPSIAALGVSVDNPHAESFNRSLKVEEVYLAAYEPFEEAQTSLAAYVACYSTKRLHACLRYISPLEYQARYYQTNSLIC